MRKSVAAWQLLQRLEQVESGLIFNGQTGRFHFLQHCRVLDPVDQRSVDKLSSNGFVRRQPSAIPVYAISDKGRSALKHREAPSGLVMADAEA